MGRARRKFAPVRCTLFLSLSPPLSRFLSLSLSRRFSLGFGPDRGARLRRGSPRRVSVARTRAAAPYRGVSSLQASQAANPLRHPGTPVFLFRRPRVRCTAAESIPADILTHWRSMPRSRERRRPQPPTFPSLQSPSRTSKPDDASLRSSTPLAPPAGSRAPHPRRPLTPLHASTSLPPPSFPPPTLCFASRRFYFYSGRCAANVSRIVVFGSRPCLPANFSELLKTGVNGNGISRGVLSPGNFQRFGSNLAVGILVYFFLFRSLSWNSYALHLLVHEHSVYVRERGVFV